MSYLKYFENKRIVIPGGNGFLGSHIIDKLQKVKCQILVPQTKDGIDFLYIKASGSHPSRKVPINKSAKKAIDEYINIRPETEEDTLYVTKNGRPLLVRNIRTTIDKAFEKAGIKNAKVNDLRNTFIAHHLANGVSLVTVSKLVGHKRLSTTEKYLGLVDNNKPEAEKSLKDL